MATTVDSVPPTADDAAPLARHWWAILIRGIAAILFGVLSFVLPGVTLAVMVLLFGAYAVVDGIFALVAAARGRDRDLGTPWWALVLEGVLSIAAGIVTFAWPGLTTLVLVYVIGTWAIITGVLEVVAAIRLRKEITGEFWLALGGVASIVFGVLLYVLPAAGALAIVLWTGTYAIVFGAFLVGLALRLRNVRRHPHQARMAHAA
jgi:uncharacterized membrane protein HdeD (DUF308 family)